MTNGVQNLLKIALDAMFEFHRLHYTTRCMHAPLPARYAPDYPDTTKTSLSIFTRAQYAPGLCVCVRLYVCVCVCVCVYMCVVKKHACLRLTVRNSPQKRTLLPVY